MKPRPPRARAATLAPRIPARFEQGLERRVSGQRPRPPRAEAPPPAGVPRRGSFRVRRRLRGGDGEGRARCSCREKGRRQRRDTERAEGEWGTMPRSNPGHLFLAPSLGAAKCQVPGVPSCPGRGRAGRWSLKGSATAGHGPVIPTLWEAEAGGFHVRAQPGQFSDICKALPQRKKYKRTGDTSHCEGLSSTPNTGKNKRPATCFPPKGGPGSQESTFLGVRLSCSGSVFSVHLPWTLPCGPSWFLEVAQRGQGARASGTQP